MTSTTGRGSNAKHKTAQLPSADRKLVQIVDAAFNDAAQRSGAHLLCRAGCTQCCVGVFPINQLDAARLQAGMRDLQANDPERAARVRKRAEDSVSRIAPAFPGDSTSGLLYEDEASQARFEDFANDEPCPALDPKTGRCDLYSTRPMTCRVFGPPVRTEHGLGVCELCFRNATPEEIAACEMVPDPDDLESKLNSQIETNTGSSGRTLVAFCLID